MIVNGEKFNLSSIEKPYVLDKLILHFALSPQRVAIELNGELIQRSAYSKTSIGENDTVEIIHYVGGG